MAEVVLLDVNVLIYAHIASLPQHPATRNWFEHALSKNDVLIPWSAIHAFLRLTTKQRLFSDAFTPHEATLLIDSWIARQNVFLLSPGARYWSILRGLIEQGALRGDIIMDAHIAALAIENDAAVCTTDRDFARFANVRVIDPLR